MSDQREKAAMRAYIERKLPQARREQRLGFLIGSLVTAIVMTILAWVFTATGIFGSHAPSWIGMVLLTIALFVGSLLHTLSVLLDGKAGEPSLRRNLAMRYRIEKAIYGTDVDALFEEAAAEKPKRDAYRLTDDGEIVAEDELPDADQPAVRRKNQF
jgi:hypothetical protein